jgi:hypothetical protein
VSLKCFIPALFSPLIFLCFYAQISVA